MLRVSLSVFFLSIVAACSALSDEFPLEFALTGQAGSYDVKRWKQDWAGCKFEDGIAEGHAALIQDMGRNWLRITCVPNQIGPEKGGIGWRWPFKGNKQIELSYIVRFDKEFEFVKGGKLPGLSGGPESVTGGRPANGKNGFSARIMWRRDGRGEAYLYHMDQPDKYGESLPFPDDFRFPLGEPIQILLRVAMNSVDKADGTIEVSVRRKSDLAPVKVVEKRNLRWRSDENILIDSLLCEVFHGGNDTSWAPKKACSVDLTRFQISRF